MRFAIQPNGQSRACRETAKKFACTFSDVRSPRKLWGVHKVRREQRGRGAFIEDSSLSVRLATKWMNRRKRHENESANTTTAAYESAAKSVFLGHALCFIAASSL